MTETANEWPVTALGLTGFVRFSRRHIFISSSQQYREWKAFAVLLQNTKEEFQSA
jgi:hypothetical protein